MRNANCFREIYEPYDLIILNPYSNPNFLSKFHHYRHRKVLLLPWFWFLASWFWSTASSASPRGRAGRPLTWKRIHPQRLDRGGGESPHVLRWFAHQKLHENHGDFPASHIWLPEGRLFGWCYIDIHRYLGHISPCLFMKHGLFERSWTNRQREWLTTSVSPLTLLLPPQNHCRVIAYSWWLTLNLLSWNLKRCFFAKALCLPSLREPVKEEDTEISTQRSLWEVSTDGGLPCLAVLGGAVGVKKIVEFRGYICICTRIYIYIYL